MGNGHQSFELLSFELLSFELLSGVGIAHQLVRERLIGGS
jgi:hypothetical protein